MMVWSIHVPARHAAKTPMGTASTTAKMMVDTERARVGSTLSMIRPSTGRSR